MQRTLANTERTLSNALWATAESRRDDRADPWSDTLPQLAVLLLLRWVDLVDAEREAIALFNDEDYERALSEELAWESWSTLHGPALTEHIQHVLLPGLAATRPDAFPIDLSHPAIAGALGPHTPLDRLVQAVAEIPFETAADQRRAGEAFGELVRSTVTKSRHGGAFATPPAVAKLMAHLAAPRPGERIFDPCFGSGEVLVQCIDQLHTAEDFHTAMQWERVQAESIFGVEISPAIHLIGLVRVLLAGVHQPGLVLGDALHRPVENAHAQRFDVVVAVPPWGKRHRADLGAQEQFPFRSNTLEATFLQLAMASLRPGGRTVLAMPDAFLFRGGAEQAIRRWLLEEHSVEAVIQLPAESFKPYTGVRISLLVLSKGGTTERVRFVDLNALDDVLHLDRDLEQILAWTRGERSGKAVRVVPTEELAERGWAFIAPSEVEGEYQTLTQELGELDVIRLVALADAASISNGLGYTRAKTTEDAKDAQADRGLIRVRDVDERKVRPPSLFAHPELSERAKEGQVLRSGDLVVTSSGSIGRVGTVTNGSVGCIATNGVLVVRPQPGLSARYLGAVLRSPILQELMKSLARGIAVQRLPLSALKRLALPIPPIQIQERIADAIEHKGGDALALLRLVLTEDTHPVVTFLEAHASVHAVRQLRNALAHVQTADLAEDPLAVLRRFGKGLLRMHSTGPVALPCTSDMVADAHQRWPSYDFDDDLRRTDQMHAWMRRVAFIAKGLAGSATDAHDATTVVIQVAAQSAVASALVEAKRSIPEDLKAHTRALERALDSAWFLLTRASRALVRDVSIEARQVFPDGRQTTLFELLGPGRTVTVEVRNVGRAPVLEFEATLAVSMSEPLCTLSEPVLLGDQEGRVTASLPDELGDTFHATLVWHGTTASLEEIGGEIVLEFTVPRTEGANIHAVSSVELGFSPYILGNPVDRPEMFFGREDILDQMRLHLSREGVANVILLEGNRRTGKTSILKSLQRPDTLPTHIPVYCSFQASAGHDSKLGVPTDEVFKTIGRALVKDCTLAGFPLPVPGVPDDLAEWTDKKRKGFIHMKLPQLVNAWFRERAAFSALDSLVQVAIDSVAPKRLLLMLDEFDKLQEGIDSGVTSPQVPENIRYLFQNNTDMAGVLTGSRRIRRLREEYWNALFGFGFAISVTALPEDAAARLVQEPVAGRLAYQPDAVEQITTLCARHPFLIQLLCARVFDHAVADDVRHVSKKQVDAAVEDLIRDNEHFRTLWGYAGSERARYILRLCHDLQDGPDPVTFDLLQNQLEAARVGYALGDGFGGGFGDGFGDGSGAGAGSGNGDGTGYGGGYGAGAGGGDGTGSGGGFGFGLPDGSGWGDGRGPEGVHGVAVSADSLRDDLDHLRELELISQVPDGHYHVYQLTVPLMGLWIEQNIDSRELRKLAVQEGRQER